MQAVMKAGVFGLLLLGLGACSGLDTTTERTLSGGAIGAGVGAVGTVLTGGCVACGAAIGGVVGAGAGFAYDQFQKAGM